MRKILIFVFLVFLTVFFYERYEQLIFKNSFFKKEILKININNLKLLNEKFILSGIYLKEGDSFWKYNPNKLRNNLKSLNEVDSFSFKLHANGTLDINIIEKKPYMIWSLSNKHKFIDENANILNIYNKPTHKLTNVKGYLNKEKFIYLNKELKGKPTLKNSIKNIIYNENIGWKLTLNDNTCVYIPETDIEIALKIFNIIRNSKIYLKYRTYDLRILERVYIRKMNKCLIS